MGRLRPVGYRGGSIYHELLLDEGSRTPIGRRLNSLLLLLLLLGAGDEELELTGGGRGAGSGAGCPPHFGHPHGAGAQQPQLGGYGG